MTDKTPTATRILKDTTDWDALSPAQIINLREKVNRKRASRTARIITGWPVAGARIDQDTIDLPDRRLTLRVHRPKKASGPLPLILSFHGGAFMMGTAAQNDWLNSFLAARMPALVVSVEYRLAPEYPLPLPVDDGYDTLLWLVDNHEEWGIEPGAVAVLGESAGGTIAALIALRAREHGPALRAQVLTAPVTDWTATMTDYPSVAAHSESPGLSLSLLRAARRLSVPESLDPLSVSPLKHAQLSGLPPSLVVTGALDPVGDHGRHLVERLVEDGTDALLSDHPRAIHAFLSLPGLVPAARPARDQILSFLGHHTRSTAPMPEMRRQ